MSTVIRVGDLGRWTAVGADQSIKFDKEKPRKIRVDVRASDEALWFIDRVNDDGEVVSEFLCYTPPGMSVIEMSASFGGVQLTPQFAGYLFVQTPEYEKINLESANPGESFLKVAHRRQRNPEVEYMEFLMNQNIRQRMAAMDEEIARRLAQLPTNERNEHENSGGADGLHQRPSSQREELQKAAAGGSGGNPGSKPAGAAAVGQLDSRPDGASGAGAGDDAASGVAE